MARAVFIKNPHTGEYYQRSIWYSAARKLDAQSALESYRTIEAETGLDLAPVLVFSDETAGE